MILRRTDDVPLRLRDKEGRTIPTTRNRNLKQKCIHLIVGTEAIISRVINPRLHKHDSFSWRHQILSCYFRPQAFPNGWSREALCPICLAHVK